MNSTNTPSETHAHAHAAKANDKDEHGPSLNAKAKKEKAQISLILRLLLCFNFMIAPVKDGLAPLVSVYLVAAKGWDAGRAGVIWFARDGSALLSQTFVGGFVDGSEHKRLLLILATFTAGLAASSIAFSQNFIFLIMKSIVEGVAICFIVPCKNSLALGLIGPEKFDQVAKVNEVADHSGSFIFIVIAGVVSFCLYPNNVGVFYTIGAGALMACVSLMLMPLTLNISVDEDNNTDSSLSSNHNEDDVDVEATAQDDDSSPSRRPGLAKTKSIIDQKSSRNLVGDEAWSYSKIFKDKNIALFCTSIFFFHLGNGALLPLLSQILAIDSGRAGIPYTCTNIAITQMTSIFGAWGMGNALKKDISYKIPIILGYVIAVPIRCVFIVLLLKFWPNNYALMATQLFDGVGVGTFSLSVSVVTKALTKGTGRFSFTLGINNTAQMVGAALSNLIGGYIVNLAGYTWGFICLAIMGSISVALASFMTFEKDGRMTEEDIAMKRRKDHVDRSLAETGHTEMSLTGHTARGGDLTQTTHHTTDV